MSTVTVRPLVDLTDEELVVLGDADGSAVVLPYLDGLDTVRRESALLTAFRGLVARGWVRPETAESPAGTEEMAAAGGPGEGTVSVPVEILGELADLLAFRRTAGAVVCAQRSAGGRREFRYAHVGAGGTLDERVSEAGLHRFGLIDTAELATEWAAYVLDPQAAGESGSPRAIDAADAEVLARCRVATDLVVRRVGDGGPNEMFGLFSGPDGVHLTRSRFGAGEPVTIRQVDPAEVTTLLTNFALPKVSCAATRAASP